jgi:threonine synthase
MSDAREAAQPYPDTLTTRSPSGRSSERSDPGSAYAGVLRCLRCGHTVPDPATGVIGRGCPRCAADGVPVNMLPEYDLSGITALPVDTSAPGLFRYRDLLPIRPGTPPVSLGEGGTPLLDLPRLAARSGVAQLLVKDETRNPTWSYKDRLAAVAVTKAVEAGADTVVVASTGNHGAAVAAYAARAGLRCVVLTLASVRPELRTLMQVYGARVVALHTGPERWTLMRRLVDQRGWMPMSGMADPPVGSNPFGIDGYKTIAYEIVADLGGAPDVVVLPAAYADGLAGLHRGFLDLVALGVVDAAPRLLAAEPLGPLAAALASGLDVAGPVPFRPSVAFSTASPVGTYQGLWALRESDGAAVAVLDDDEILDMQAELGQLGLYVEASSATSFVALAAQRGEAGLDRDSCVVVLNTSTGLKDVAVTAARQPDVPVIDADPRQFDEALGGVGWARWAQGCGWRSRCPDSGRRATPSGWRSSPRTSASTTCGSPRTTANAGRSRWRARSRRPPRGSASASAW